MAWWYFEAFFGAPLHYSTCSRLLQLIDEWDDLIVVVIIDYEDFEIAKADEYTCNNIILIMT